MRWKMTAWYRTDAGLIDVDMDIDELIEVDRLIEAGPSFYAIDRIEIRLSAPSTQTIEGALAE